MFCKFSTLFLNENIKARSYRKSEESWNPLAGGKGLSGNRSRPSPTLLLGLDVGSANNPPFLKASAIFFERPRRFSRLPVLSIVVALRNKHTALLTVRGQEKQKNRKRGKLPTIRTYLRRADLPGLASRLIIHHELLPVPSFCTRMNLLCSDKL